MMPMDSDEKKPEGEGLDFPSIFEEAVDAGPVQTIEAASETPVEAAPITPLEMEMPPIDAAEFEAPVESTNAIHAAPAASVHTISPEPALSTDAIPTENLAETKKFGEKITVGAAKVEANPAFSLLARGIRGEKAIKAVEDALSNEDYGVRFDDVRVQLETGKLLVPQISEFAAITLAQKLREYVDQIELGPASDIYSSSAHSIDELTSHGMTQDLDWIDPSDANKGEAQEIHDLSNEPASENEVFTTNLPEMEGYTIRRILSALTVSEVVDAEIAEKEDSREFEQVIQRLNKEMIHRAYTLGASGVVGVSIALKAIDGYRDSLGNIKRAYRVLASGTAVRAKQHAISSSGVGFTPLFGKRAPESSES